MGRRRKIAWLVLAALFLAGLLVARWLLSPGYLLPTLLSMAGRSLGLEITADGVGDYRLRGTPELTVRNLVAREPGAATPVLRAERLYVSVPWATLRARGQDLTANRIELDAPVLDMAAFNAWLAKRPPGETKVPTLSRGIGIVRGRVIGEGWKLEGLEAQVPSLAPAKPLRAHVEARYSGSDLSAPFDVHVTLTEPAAGASIGVVGDLSAETPQWRLASYLHLSAKLAKGSPAGLRHAVVGARSRYVAGDTTLRFASGVAGSVVLDGGALRIDPLGLSLIGDDSLAPTLHGAGRIALGSQLELDLQGALAQWPSAWPALPPPIGQSTSVLPFALSYQGANDLSDPMRLQLQRDATRFDARFRLPDILGWIDAGTTGSPLPPLSGRLTTPRVEISGAVLEGVQVEIEDPTLPEDAPAP